MNYPDGLSDRAICHIEGCLWGPGQPHCPRCGKVNYYILGCMGAAARWAKYCNPDAPKPDPARRE